MNSLERKNYYKYLFLIGAIWNLVVGFLFIALSPLADSVFPLFGMESPTSLVFFQGFFGLTSLFGIGYYLVSRNIEKNHGIILLGVIGKFYLFILFLIYFIIGASNFLPVATVIVDLVFGCLFVEFLISIRKID